MRFVGRHLTNHKQINVDVEETKRQFKSELRLDEQEKTDQSLCEQKEFIDNFTGSHKHVLREFSCSVVCVCVLAIAIIE